MGEKANAGQPWPHIPDVIRDRGKSDVIREYTEFHRKTDWTHHRHEHNAPELSHHVHGLTEEAGEVAGIFKKITRVTGYFDKDQFLQLLNNDYHERMIEELGDVLWYYNKILEWMGLDIETLMVANTYKLYHRLLDNDHFDEIEWPFTAPEYSYEVVHKQLGSKE